MSERTNISAQPIYQERQQEHQRDREEVVWPEDSGEERIIDMGEIVGAYLEKHGFDGLVEADGECACEKGDLAPCGEPSLACRAGYKGACDCGEHDWHIYPTKADALASLREREELSDGE